MLILQPLLGRNGQNVCDVPVIAKETVQFEFSENTASLPVESTSPYTTTVLDETTSTSVEIRTLKLVDKFSSSTEENTNASSTPWWWREEKKNITIDVHSDSNSNDGLSNNAPVNTKLENHIIRDGFIINNDKKVDKEDSTEDKTHKNDLNIVDGSEELSGLVTPSTGRLLYAFYDLRANMKL